MYNKTGLYRGDTVLFCFSCKKFGLLAEAESLHDCAVAVDVAVLQVVEERTTLTYQLHKRAFSRIIFTVSAHVLRQMGNTVRKQGDLAFSRTSIRVRRAVLSKDFLLLYRIQVHNVNKFGNE